jgi:hypothetical protein
MDDPPLSRRRLLAGSAVGALAAAAGCLGFDEDTTSQERALVLTFTRHDGPLRDQYVEDLEESRSPHDEEAFRTTLGGGTYTTQFVKPFWATPEDPVYTRHDGTYYELSSVVVDEVAATYPVLRLYEREGTPDGDAPAAEALPTVDQRAIQVAHFVARARGDEGGVPWDAVERGGFVYRRESGREASALLADDGPDRVRFRETGYDVEVSREQFHDPVHRATVTPVADDPERMERILRATLVDAYVDRATLSSEARAVFRDATASEYRESHPYSAGYETVLRELDERAYLDGDIENDAGVKPTHPPMVRYDDGYYRYRLRFTGAA